ncbi:Hypothetical predicted protein [Olea europaea subsp. europaea]|uniref:Uncharacterized protein n=2 Tax=Olea europaea subsp. europaea TaxID=158383 RepID=A0A8S0QKI2_OLEEU|nr:Hypothetical predicted protein [Olea europaea subsp. europaea]
MMSKKMKGVSLDSTSSYTVGLNEGDKAKLKHQSLLQDYQELQKESNGMRNKLQTAKQRRQILTAEVRFLQKRHKYLLETKFLNSSQEQQLVQPAPYAVSHIIKKKKDQMFSKKVTSLKRIPQVPESKPKRKYIGKEAAPRSALPVTNIERKQKLHGKKQDSHFALTPNSDMNYRGRINIRKETLMRNKPLVIDLNERERICGANDTGLRNSVAAFDLNQDTSGREARLPSRAPIFDLNEISTGDDDFQSNYEPLKLDDARKGLVRGLHDDQHNDLKLSVCRNAGEGSTRVGKRKISWQDPVALRV